MTGTDAAEGMAGWLVARAVAAQSAFDDGHSLRSPFFSGTGPWLGLSFSGPYYDNDHRKGDLFTPPAFFRSQINVMKVK